MEYVRDSDGNLIKQDLKKLGSKGVPKIPPSSQKFPFGVPMITDSSVSEKHIERTAPGFETIEGDGEKFEVPSLGYERRVPGSWNILESGEGDNEEPEKTQAELEVDHAEQLKNHRERARKRLAERAAKKRALLEKSALKISKLVADGDIGAQFTAGLRAAMPSKRKHPKDFTRGKRDLGHATIKLKKRESPLQKKPGQGYLPNFQPTHEKFPFMKELYGAVGVCYVG